MASAPQRRSIYGTVWFGLTLTAAAVLALLAATDWQGVVKFPRGIAQVLVVALAVYWTFIFPRQRRGGG